MRNNDIWVGTGLSAFSVLGTRCTGTACSVASGSQATASFQYVATALGITTTAAITAWGFPWTSGSVAISAEAGPFPAIFTRAGYDNRTPLGAGTIQLVTPHLAHWAFPNRSAAWQRDTAAIGVLRVRFFVPEPAEWVMLGAGVALLAGLTGLRRN